MSIRLHMQSNRNGFRMADILEKLRRVPDRDASFSWRRKLAVNKIKRLVKERKLGKWVFMNITNCEEGMTMAFLTMSMCEIFHSFNMRSTSASIFQLFKENNHNRFLVFTMILSLIFTTCVIEIPFLANAFGFTPITYVEYGISLLLALSIIPIVEIVKYFQRKK